MKKLTTQQKEAIERQKEITHRLFAVDRDAPLSVRLREASDVLFLTCRNGYLPDGDMVNALALASGYACGVMADAAHALKEESQ